MIDKFPDNDYVNLMAHKTCDGILNSNASTEEENKDDETPVLNDVNEEEIVSTEAEVGEEVASEDLGDKVEE